MEKHLGAELRKRNRDIWLGQDKRRLIKPLRLIVGILFKQLTPEACLGGLSPLGWRIQRTLSGLFKRDGLCRGVAARRWGLAIGDRLGRHGSGGLVGRVVDLR